MTSVRVPDTRLPEPEPAPRRRALLLLARDPRIGATGRHAVLATAVESLQTLGHDVSLAAVGAQPSVQTWQGLAVHSVPMPGVLRTGLNVIRTGARRDRCLNEALFHSPEGARRVRELVAALGIDYIVADGLRVVEPALSTGLPVVAHLDDLLSDRYRQMRAAGGHDVLGYFAGHGSRPVAAVGRWLAPRLLGAEASLIGRRERRLTRASAVCALTSELEAAELSRRSGVAVDWLPMAIAPEPARSPADTEASPRHSMVFLGSPDLPGNMTALRWWQTAIRPALDAAGGEDVVLTVIGEAAKDRQRELGDDRIRFAGYVDDVGLELGRHRAMVAPIVGGTGIKTKVLDGLAHGLPVVATGAAVAGLGLVPGQGALISDDPAEFAAHVLRLRDDPAAAVALASRGREAVERGFLPSQVTDRWSAALARAALLVDEVDLIEIEPAVVG